MFWWAFFPTFLSLWCSRKKNAYKSLVTWYYHQILSSIFISVFKWIGKNFFTQTLRSMSSDQWDCDQPDPRGNTKPNWSWQIIEFLECCVHASECIFLSKSLSLVKWAVRVVKECVCVWVWCCAAAAARLWYLIHTTDGHTHAASLSAIV